jgi:sn-glycerol 3-phosphate transport system ATP-binding protein
MLYVTHDQTEAMSLADRVVVLDKGQVLQVGAPDEIYRRPISPRVARMLGSPPINLMTQEQARQIGWAQFIQPSHKTLGIRPEHLRLRPSPGGSARVTLLERLGPMTVLRLDSHGVAMRANVDPSLAVSLGDTFDVSVSPADVIAWTS